ncbi:hypothetical protein [Adhaeribacter soli]|uniref:Outer membrane beta-barrel protein n=1 Tax=Adhaeribacter soli TaxID=2607655 RepID=A0A5N1IM92_9BACT|nr:hypothetical protein [Adhaeribacter soli]KAA9324921.1 hypothetical protein F0P94_19300 [Adhaeribacter soli]
MKTKIWFIALGWLLLASSCSSVYMPNVPNTPMLSAQGELYSSAHITFKGNASFNTAYAVSDHFGVLLNGSLMNSNREKKDFRHNLLEAGGGYFTTFGDNNKRILEIYGGLGWGSSDRTFKKKTSEGPVSYDRQEVSFTKYFVQVNFSKKKQETLRLFGHTFPMNYGTALRASYINMSEFTRNDVKQPTEDNIFLEPIFFTRISLTPSVQFQYTSGFNVGLKNREFLTAGNSVSSFGFVVNVGGRNSRRGPKN